MTKHSRCGFVALAGAPNAGKSTLLNRMAGTKLAIATPRAQTTRFKTLGLVLRGNAQIVFMDLPGFFSPRRRLDRAMNNAAWDGVRTADLLLFLIDARKGLDDGVQKIAAQISEENKSGRLPPLWVVFTKTDLAERSDLPALIRVMAGLSAPDEIFLTSARTGSGVGELLDHIAAVLPEGPFLYPEDEISDLSERMLVAELVREQVFLQTREEIPYQCTVETESFSDRKDGSCCVNATVYVSRAGHKGILIGERGRKIGEIGKAARLQAEEIMGRRVHLFLNVKVREGWDEENARLRALGLDAGS